MGLIAMSMAPKLYIRKAVEKRCTVYCTVCTAAIGTVRRDFTELDGNKKRAAPLFLGHCAGSGGRSQVSADSSFGARRETRTLTLFRRGILSPLRLPFRHPGEGTHYPCFQDLLQGMSEENLTAAATSSGHRTSDATIVGTSKGKPESLSPKFSL